MIGNYNPKQYKRILSALNLSRRKILTVAQSITEDLNAAGPFLILRHDVDDDMRYAVEMAELEHSLGIRSTYYIRRQSKVWIPENINHLYSLGHEIGYHYECLSKAEGDFSKAISLFTAELNELREIVPNVTTCCMHGAILSKWDNRKIWDAVSFEKFGLRGEAYLSLADKEIAYFSDSGYSWDGRYRVFDHFRGITMSVGTTQELIDIILSKEYQRLYLLTHPIIWMGTSRHRFAQMIREYILRIPKKFFIHLRQKSGFIYRSVAK